MISEDSKIRISMISTSYPKNTRDWKGVFIRQIAQELAKLPEIQLSLWCPPGEIASTVKYICSQNEALWLEMLMDQGGIAHAIRSKKLSGAVSSIKLLLMLKRVYNRISSKTHIYHINWLQNMLPLEKGSHPVLATVLGQDFGLLKIPGMNTALRRKFRQRPCTIAPNADWMLPELQHRFGDLATVKAIPFGIDVAWYNIARNYQEEALPRIWLVVSRLTSRKIGPLFEWGNSLFSRENELHLFGPMQEQLNLPSWIHYHGPTYPSELAEKWFPRSAGLITLSNHDEGRPQVMLEAMASGLPIIASRLPAHEDLLRHRSTGCIVDSLKDFKEEIDWLGNKRNNDSISLNAKQWVKSAFGTWADCARRYLASYQDLMVEI
jgi:glycosyltransferase involved in cell wall biosynthesis